MTLGVMANWSLRGRLARASHYGHNSMAVGDGTLKALVAFTSLALRRS